MGCRFSFFCFFLISTTCQVGHFDSHTFWSLIEFFIENLVLSGGRYIRTFSSYRMHNPIHLSRIYGSVCSYLYRKLIQVFYTQWFSFPKTNVTFTLFCRVYCCYYRWGSNLFSATIDTFPSVLMKLTSEIDFQVLGVNVRDEEISRLTGFCSGFLSSNIFVLH